VTAADELRRHRWHPAGHFPAAPDAINVLESEAEPQIRFVDLQVDGTPNYGANPHLTVDEGIVDHEYGHELEAQLIRAGDTRDALRTALWTRRGLPGTWQQQEQDANASAYGPVGSLGWWAALPVEIVAESISRSILGAPWAERHMYSYMPIDHDAELRWWQDRFAAKGVEVPAVRTLTFAMSLTEGRADRIGANAFALTETQRAALRLISGQGRRYAVDIARVGLTGTETTLPDTRGWLVEDTAVAVGANGRWRLNAMARRDYGGTGYYEARILDVTAAI
jgi:hypothetical protein